MSSEAEIAALRTEVAELRKVADAILRGVVLLTRHLGAVAKPAAAGAAGGRIAAEGELDSKYGDPSVRFDPRDWTGESFKGSTFSQCPPDYLEILAVVLDGFADGEEDAKKKKYKRDDAARARGWAKRLRARAEEEL